MMKFFKLKKFHDEEDGAVTVDWVVLTAAVVGLGAAALALVRTQTAGLSDRIATYLNGATVSDSFTADEITAGATK
ncbi:hypothetical protein B6V75_16225 [Thioclava sp. F1Mire-8]|uniref:hypothetical protein n=1 Tax=Thioclava sp. F1Mire-8 TaxID=1973006 RepID=UPI000B6E8ACF|nr:hypothetical protein [Thioclava sp. F1Mire-8]OWY01159.1 hypothetical protein B6V75_16225 [Thioclava sp. F1Mire-8]